MVFSLKPTSFTTPIRPLLAFLTILLMSGFVPSLCIGSPFSVQPKPLADVLATALKNNQDFLSAQATAQRFHSRIAMVEDLDDQLLAAYYFEFPLSEEIEEKTLEGSRIRAKMRFEFSDHRLEMVENQALWYKYLSEDIRLQLIRQVKETFYRLYFQDRVIAVNEESLGHLDGLIRISQAQYAVGKVRQFDVLKLQNERAQQFARILELKQEREERAARLSYLMSQSATLPISPLVEPDLTPATLPILNKTFQVIVSSHSKNRPLFKGYQALTDRLDAMRMMVQLYMKQDVRSEGVIEANNGLRYIKARSTDVFNRSLADLKVAYTGLLKNKELAKLYDEVILPQSRQIYQSLLADFQVGQKDIRDTLQALIALNRNQVTAFDAQANYLAELCKLERLSGMHLFGPSLQEK